MRKDSDKGSVDSLIAGAAWVSFILLDRDNTADLVVDAGSNLTFIHSSEKKSSSLPWHFWVDDNFVVRKNSDKGSEDLSMAAAACALFHLREFDDSIDLAVDAGISVRFAEKKSWRYVFLVNDAFARASFVLREFDDSVDLAVCISVRFSREEVIKIFLYG